MKKVFVSKRIDKRGHRPALSTTHKSVNFSLKLTDDQMLSLSIEAVDKGINVPKLVRKILRHHTSHVNHNFYKKGGRDLAQIKQLIDKAHAKHPGVILCACGKIKSGRLCDSVTEMDNHIVLWYNTPDGSTHITRMKKNETDKN